jgi:hypothetical protein
VARIEVTLTAEQLDRLAAVIAERIGETRDSETGWLRGAEKIARYIDAPPSRVYALASAGRIPCERDGSSLIAHRGDLDAWLRAGGGRRP